MNPSPSPGPGEFDVIARIASGEAPHAAVPMGIGDDCALVRPGGNGDVLVTTDMLMDGRHFRLDQDGAEAIGTKCLGVNLSDIAAMAGTPLAAFVAVALPRADASSIADGLIAGMRPMAERFGVALAGGDTNAWDGPLVVCVTILGRAEPPGPVTRSGARIGDAVFVTGPLGGSLARGRHLTPRPRIEEAKAIRAIAPIHAMIDLSDGLSSDLPHILKASGGLGCVLDVVSVPIHPDAVEMARVSGRAPLLHALDDGEDFELAFTVANEDAPRLIAEAARLGIDLHRIGAIDDGPGLRLRDPDGRVTPVDRGGFDHLKAGARE
jgi:thiamine-monophosphate kinase